MVEKSGMHAAIRELGTLFNEGAVGMLSDGQLLDRFVERREASAFEAIVERYGPLVWGVCRRVLRDHHDAEDAFQATFLVLARRAASVMPREKLGNWLYGVAFQTAMKARATRAKRRVRERPAWEMTEPEAVRDEHADELLSRLDREVARLPEKYRMPIILCELEGKTHRQAAEQLGWPVGTVSGRLSRARALLASRLSRPGTPLTVGALGVLLAHDAARAGVPPELVRSTAQAASLSMAGKAVTAGVVSAEVAALTGEVLKTMLLNKLTLTTAMLLVALTARSRRDEPHLPGTRHGTSRIRGNDSEKPKEQSNPAEAVKEDMPPPKDQPKFAEAAKEDIPKDPNCRHQGGHEEHVSAGRDPATRTPTHPILLRILVHGLADGERGLRLQSGDPRGEGRSAERDGGTPDQGDAGDADGGPARGGRGAASRGAEDHPGRRLQRRIGQVVAPGPGRTSQRSRPVDPEFQCAGVAGLRLEGPKITRVAVYNIESGKWSPLDLDEPASGVVQPMALGPGALAYQGRSIFIHVLMQRHPRGIVWTSRPLRRDSRSG